jgi:translation initiation factor 2 alpha subunit (eIF-2alpha)
MPDKYFQSQQWHHQLINLPRVKVQAKTSYLSVKPKCIHNIKLAIIDAGNANPLITVALKFAKKI